MITGGIAVHRMSGSKALHGLCRGDRGKYEFIFQNGAGGFSWCHRRRIVDSETTERVSRIQGLSDSNLEATCSSLIPMCVVVITMRGSLSAWGRSHAS